MSTTNPADDHFTRATPSDAGPVVCTLVTALVMHFPGLYCHIKCNERLLARLSPLLCTLVAALVMHFPGLYCQIKYNERLLTRLGAVTGAVCEGTFFVLLLSKAVSTIRVSAEKRYDFFSLEGAQLLFSLMAAVGLSAFFLACSVGDYMFQSMSGGITPTMWVVVAGFKSAREQAQGQLTMDSTGTKHKIALVFCCFAIGMTIHFLGNRGGLKKCASSKRLSAWAVAAVLVYAAGGWSPVLHSYMSFCGSFALQPPGAEVVFRTVNVTGVTNTHTSTPNVILLIHESLSGAYALDPHGMRAFSFLNSLRGDDNFYQFPNARSVSGDTKDALTAIATGCLPFTKKGYDIAYTRSIATEFKHQGYRTGAFSSRKLNLQGTEWNMLHNFLAGNMDEIFDPLSLGYSTINAEGAEDRLFTPHFDKWLTHTVNQTPFFAQFYQFNSHWPYVKDKNSTSTVRYYASMETIDQSLQALFQILNRTGQQNNTIIIGTGDHGEYLRGDTYTRLSDINPYILVPFTYMYIPKHLFPSPQARDRLRSNENKAVSTLDLFPTMQHFLYGGDSQETAHARNKTMAADVRSEEECDHCVTGFDLLSTPIPSDRLAISWKTVPIRKGLQALSNAERGIKCKSMHQPLERMFFGNCTMTGETACAETITKDDHADIHFWLNTLRGMCNSSTVSKAFMKSGFPQCFFSALGKVLSNASISTSC